MTLGECGWGGVDSAPLPSALTTLYVCGLVRYSCSNALQCFRFAGVQGRFCHFPSDVSFAIGSSVKVPEGSVLLVPIPPSNMPSSRETAASVTVSGLVCSALLVADVCKHDHRMIAKRERRLIWLDLTPVVCGDGG